MKPNEFLNKIDHDQVIAAIAEAEKKTSGEIRVFVSHKDVTDPVVAAQQQFNQLGMSRTGERNGVLIFIAPAARKFAVIGDEGVHQRCGAGFWSEMAAEMTRHFVQADFTVGIVHSVRKAGELLAQHFPRRSDDRNELSDRVEQD